MSELELAFDGDFRGAQIDPARWVPHYLPHWSSRERAAARLGRHDGRPALHIEPDQPPWCPEWDGDLRASVLQTGLYAGPLGSGEGQLHFRDDLVVREEQENRRTYLPHQGYVELRCRAVADPAVMVALWMCGYEQRPEECGEICVAEIFGSDVGPDRARIGMGIKAFHDPGLVEEFSADEYAIDATQFHTYAASCTDDGVEFLLDDEVVKSTTQSPGLPDAADAGDLRVPGAGDVPGPGAARRPGAPLGVPEAVRRGLGPRLRLASWSAGPRPGRSARAGWRRARPEPRA